MSRVFDRTFENEQEEGGGASVASTNPIHRSKLNVQTTIESTSRTRSCTPTERKGYRMSIFKEIGLDSRALSYICYGEETESISPIEKLHLNTVQHRKEEGQIRSNILNRLTLPGRTKLVAVDSSPPPVPLTNVPRFALLVFLVAVLPAFLYIPRSGSPRFAGSGAAAGMVKNEKQIKERADSPTNVCKRWSHQGEFLDPQR
jgi:hypothetical protein